MQDQELKKKLDAINEEFHQMIDTYDHCYNRKGPNARKRCDCEYYWAKWLKTKKEAEEK